MKYAKLTLRPTQEVIDLARQFAAERHISITQMFSNYILRQKQERDRKDEKDFTPGPMLREIMRMTEGMDLSNVPTDDDKILTDILCERYLEGKRG